MRFQIVTYAAIFAVGLAGGFYIALYLQNQIGLLAGVAVLFAFLTWLGSGTEIIGLLREWYKETREKVTFAIEYNPQANPGLAMMLELLTMTGERTNVSRKYLKVCVTNSGGIVAKRCKATLQVKTGGTSTRLPSPEPKVLLWETGQSYQDIGINGTENLHIVLSDSRSAIHPEENVYALVSTPDTVNMIPPNTFRAQDGFGQGDTYFDLVVTSESGEAIQAHIRVHVTTNWQELSMEKLLD